MANATSFDRNHILKYAPRQEREVIKEAPELVSLKTKEEINQVDSRLRYVHFPTDSAISLMDLQSSGQAVEVAGVGMEGCTAFDVRPLRLCKAINGRRAELLYRWAGRRSVLKPNISAARWFCVNPSFRLDVVSFTLWSNAWVDGCSRTNIAQG